MQSACLKGARNGLMRGTTVVDWRPRQRRRPNVLEYRRRCRTTSLKRLLHWGHSRDRISYPLATSVTCMTTLLTLQAMHSNSAFMAPQRCIRSPPTRSRYDTPCSATQSPSLPNPVLISDPLIRWHAAHTKARLIGTRWIDQ